MWRNLAIALGLVALGATGCAGLQKPTCTIDCAPCEAAGGDGKKCDYDCEAKTLFNWAVCKEDEDKKEETCPCDDKDKENGEKKDGEKKADPQEKVGQVQLRDGQIVPVQLMLPAVPTDGAVVSGRTTGAVRTLTGTGLGRLGSRGNGDGGEEDDGIVTDRPDFTEASSTVGKGRIQLEAGYTYFQNKADGVRVRTHSYPEALLRVGLFADWFELRLGQNFNTAQTNDNGAVSTLTGATDLYIGTKLGLVEQKGIFPEMALILQATVPTGRREFSSREFLPGVSLLYSWELNDKWSLAGSVLGNKAIDNDRRAFLMMASSLSVGYSFTDKLGSYFEYFGFYPSGAVASGVKPEYYLNGGFTYKVTKNFQLDVRAGFGLNEAADDFFTGAGFAVRY